MLTEKRQEEILKLVNTNGSVTVQELKDLFAAADLVVSRAGANAICELLALKKPNILIPLSAAASRGDQILNAESFERQGFSYVLKEEELTNETLLTAINTVYQNRDTYRSTMEESKLTDAVATIMDLIKQYELKNGKAKK